MKKFKLTSSANGKVFRSGVYSTAILAAAIVLAVLLNLLVGALPKKYTEFDLSEAKMYTLGDSSKKLVQSLDQDVTVYYLCETGSEDAILTKLLDHYADESSHFRWVLAVFDDVGQLGIAAAVRAGFCEADLDVVVTIPVQLGGRKAECALQFARGAGFELCLSADNGGKIALDSLQHDLTTGLQDDIRHAVKVAAELGNLQKEILRHFHVALSQWSAPPFSPVPRCTFHDPLHSPRTQYRSDNHRR